MSVQQIVDQLVLLGAAPQDLAHPLQSNVDQPTLPSTMPRIPALKRLNPPILNYEAPAARDKVRALTTSKYFRDIFVSQPSYRDYSLSEEVANTFSIVHFDCPIHIVVICLNEVVDDPFAPSESSNLTFESDSASGSTREPITQIQYKYLQETIPLVYKHELLNMILPLSSFVPFEKIQQNLNVHFIVESEWPQLFTSIERDGINRRIAEYKIMAQQ